MNTTLELLNRAYDPTCTEYASLQKTVKGCFTRAQRNALIHDMWVDRQDVEDCMQEGYLRAYQDAMTLDGIEVEDPQKKFRYLLVKGFQSAIQGNAYRVIKDSMRLVSLDLNTDDEESTLADVLAMPDYKDLDGDYILTHAKLELGLTETDAQTIYELAQLDRDLNPRERKRVSRLKAKYTLK